MFDETKLRITGDPSGAIAAQEKYIAGLKKMQSETSGAFGSIKAGWVNAASGIYFVQEAWSKLQSVMEMVDVGARVMQTEEAFTHAANAVGVNAERMIADLQRVTNNTVDESDLMQKAMKAMSANMKPDDIVKLAEVSRLSARRMGVDVGEAYESIVDAVEIMKTRTLKAYGLITSDQAKLMDSAKAAGMEVDALQVIMLNHASQAEILGPIVEDQTERFKQFKVEIKDTYEEFSKLVAKIWDYVAAASAERALRLKIDGAVLRNSAQLSIEDYASLYSDPYTPKMPESNKSPSERLNELMKKYKAAGEAEKVKRAADDLANSTARWQERITSLNPFLSAEAKHLADLNTEADKLIRKFGNQSWITQGLEQGKEYLAMTEQLKTVVHDLDETEFFSGHMEGPFTEEDKAILRDYIIAMKDFDDEYATATQRASGEMATYYAQKNRSFVNGMKDGYREIYLAQMTWGEAGENFAKDSYRAMGEAWSDSIYDVITGDLDSLSDVWDATWKSMARSMANQLGTMLNNWIWFGSSTGIGSRGMTGLEAYVPSGGSSGWGGLSGYASSALNWLTSSGSSSGSGLWDTISSGISGAWDWVTSFFHEGGVVGQSNVPTRYMSASVFSDAPRLHNGLAADEYPAILQRGETVLPSGISINGIIYPIYEAADYLGNAGMTAGSAMAQGAQSISDAGNSFLSSLNRGSDTFLGTTFGIIGSIGLGMFGASTGIPFGGQIGSVVGKYVGTPVGNYISDTIFGSSFSSGPVSEEQALFGEEGWGRDFSNLADIMAEMAEAGEDLTTALEKVTTTISGGGYFGSSGGVDLAGAYSDIANAYYGGNQAAAAAMAASLGLDLGSLLASNAFGGASYANEYAPGGLFSAEAQAAANANANAGYAIGDSYGYETNFHTGGVPMYDAPVRRFVSRGVRPGERAARILDEEGVFTPGQMKAIGEGLSKSAQPIEIPIILDSREIGRAVIKNPANVRHLKAATKNYGRTL